MLYASRKINLKHLTNEEKELLGKLCGLSKEIYNSSLVSIQQTYQKQIISITGKKYYQA